MLLSLLVLFFEISLYLSEGGTVGLYDTWVNFSEHNEKTSFLLANILCIMPLAYICASSFFGFFKIKVHSFYALHAK